MLKLEKKAFSLIELLVVITIAGVLSAIALPVYTTYRVKAKISAVIPTVNNYLAAVQRYYVRTGNWPTAQDLGLGTGSVVPVPTTFPYVYSIAITPVRATNCASGTTAVIVTFSGASLGATFNNFAGYIFGASPPDSNYLVLAWQSFPENNGTTLRVNCSQVGQTGTDSVYVPSNCQADFYNYLSVCS